ncbi:DMP19 family protein [Chryseobacterium luquanense]|uniref:DMP19 family protein n=1 Tax=Chryseobacterium luquanense TaxID=2983766 RepID=A0ABT3Y271_9FLAO|nr:hypothetical protein [Chryseobacterium luquanense]MCX8532243.1 DMP19 family protein [Chryseobacterium luquanense]
MKKLDKIIVSDNSYKSSDPYKLIESNISVINLLRDERIHPEFYHPDSRISYYLDYYLAQYNNGNFSQFVWNSKWENKLNNEIRGGLKIIGAEKHLKLFIEQSEKVDSLSKPQLQDFLKSEYFGDNSTRDSLNNDEFYNLNEDLITLNSQWLRDHPDLLVLSISDMFTELEKCIGKKINH